MASPMALSNLTLTDLQRSKSRSLRFQSLITFKGAELGPILVLTINRKLYMASPMALSNLTFTDLERSKSRALRFPVVGYLYGIDVFATSNITTMWMSQKGVCWRAGFSAVPAVFLVCFLLGIPSPIYRRLLYVSIYF